MWSSYAGLFHISFCFCFLWWQVNLQTHVKYHLTQILFLKPVFQLMIFKAGLCTYQSGMSGFFWVRKFIICWDYLILFLSSLGIRITFDRTNYCWRKNWSWNAKVCSFQVKYFDYFHLFRPLIVFFGAVAVGLHLALFIIPTDYSNTFLYVR